MAPEVFFTENSLFLCRHPEAERARTGKCLTIKTKGNGILKQN